MSPQQLDCSGRCERIEVPYYSGCRSATTTPLCRYTFPGLKRLKTDEKCVNVQTRRKNALKTYRRGIWVWN
ncbi:unnamed protein product [Taenia asiatica]|uniref:Uncharacterized protein n=1 Tax=Taenia asiatica TaxID=60517 RepID=A0A3P6PAR2_TAEAS|nr:unnamed protein product [Taenia asiatica]